MQGSQTKSELTLPIIVKGTVIGVLDIQSNQLDGFDETDLDFMQSLANQTGIAIENARLFAETQRLLKETQQRAHELSIINKVQQELASKLDVQSIYDLVGDTFRDIFDAEVVMISTYDAQSNTIEHRYAIERGVRVYSPGTYPPGGFRSQIIRTRQPLLVNANVAEEAARLRQPTLAGTLTPKSWLGVPMLVGGEVMGILSVQNVSHENAFDESDVRRLQTFAASMSIALENARLYEQARHLAILEERQRLARELHDSVTQSLYGINLYAEAAIGQLTLGQNAHVHQLLNDIQKTAQESLADMRLMIYELRPPILEREGLAAALQNRLYSVENRVGLKSMFSSNLSERLPALIEEGLYRIAREALNNTLKHAHAKNVEVCIVQEEGRIVLEISDNGIGFDLQTACHEGCLGIISMRERAVVQGWQFAIDSGPGQGTRVRVEVKR
jgi:signal transduction histidine kinase